MMTIEQEVWLRAWCATASATNTYSKDRTDEWADHCLQSFRERFPIPPPMPSTLEEYLRTRYKPLEEIEDHQ